MTNHQEIEEILLKLAADHAIDAPDANKIDLIMIVKVSGVELDVTIKGATSTTMMRGTIATVIDMLENLDHNISTQSTGLTNV